MTAAQQEGVIFAGAEGGGYVFPALHPAYDGLMSFARLLELLAAQEVSLAEAVGRLPVTHVVRRRVATPWEQKGAVMRHVLEAARDAGDRPTDSTDGIKVFEEAATGSPPWALVIPDTVEPVTHLWTEAGSDEAASALADRYEQLVRRAAGGTVSAL
jgi:mannose-1-phosphate guanylyltransferase/phosphomannomutase